MVRLVTKRKKKKLNPVSKKKRVPKNRRTPETKTVSVRVPLSSAASIKEFGADKFREWVLAKFPPARVTTDPSPDNSEIIPANAEVLPSTLASGVREERLRKIKNKREVNA